MRSQFQGVKLCVERKSGSTAHAHSWNLHLNRQPRASYVFKFFSKAFPGILLTNAFYQNKYREKSSHILMNTGESATPWKVQQPPSLTLCHAFSKSKIQQKAICIICN